MSQLTREQLESEIRDIISKIIEIDSSKVEPDKHLSEDLGADSMQALEIMVALDKKYKISIAETDLPQMTSLNRILEIVSKLLESSNEK